LPQSYNFSPIYGNDWDKKCGASLPASLFSREKHLTFHKKLLAEQRQQYAHKMSGPPFFTHHGTFLVENVSLHFSTASHLTLIAQILSNSKIQTTFAPLTNNKTLTFNT